MDWTKWNASFSMTEVERVTGLNAETMRTWKRRGFLGDGARYSKLDSTQMAALMIRKQLTSLGYTPADSYEVGEKYAPYVLYHAIMDTPGACEVRGSAAAIAKFEKAFGNDGKLAARMVGIDGDKMISVLVSTDDSPLEAEAAERLSIDQDSLSGYYVNLLGLGRHLGGAAQKPLVQIDVELDGQDQSSPRIMVRRLSASTG